MVGTHSIAHLLSTALFFVQVSNGPHLHCVPFPCRADLIAVGGRVKSVDAFKKQYCGLLPRFDTVRMHSICKLHHRMAKATLPRC